MKNSTNYVLILNTKSTRSSTDRTQVCGTCDIGSIPVGCTIQSSPFRGCFVLCA